MGKFIMHTKDENLPDWLRSSLSEVCPVCHSEMMNYYNDYGQCTNRRCSNNYCPSMLAKRFEVMLSVLGLEGAGYKTGLRLISERNAAGMTVKSHIELLPLVMDELPEVTLSTFLRAMEFEGVDSQWIKICDELEVYDLDSLFAKYTGDYRYILDANKNELYRLVSFFRLKGPKFVRRVDKTIKTLNIMITGTPKGFPTKEAYVDWLNAKLCGAIKIVHIPHVRKTGVDALIRENGSTTKTKLAAAQAAGIPILTSEEFIQVLTNILVQEMKKQKEGTV